ncbi:hypothetical protein BTO05_01955 [Winogradskyella sp. PC-19]|uniref:hypothetical protein n=1 Tax=unclassified Winogradskyella TaxID=2615021 RepID=UPI000B3D3732|nr:MULTISPECIES: hypothetical protein [unclassified Winogradskyella]ARV08466.1 hypothetical protein BTO05_01955 [Winogradskyella sp. PC-19]
MKKAFILICILFTTANATAQFGRQGGLRNNRLGRQQPNVPPNENQKANIEKKNAERQAEYIANFLATLEADDFQKEIAKQTMDEYFELTKKFMKVQFDNSVERKDAFDGFKREHFRELKTMLSESDNVKLDEFLEGKFKEGEEKKKKKKKRKKKKRNNDN